MIFLLNILQYQLACCSFFFENIYFSILPKSIDASFSWIQNRSTPDKCFDILKRSE